MKKITVILGLSLLTSTAAFAQKSLVKEVEREVKSNPASYFDAVNKIRPAFCQRRIYLLRTGQSCFRILR